MFGIGDAIGSLIDAIFGFIFDLLQPVIEWLVEKIVLPVMNGVVEFTKCILCNMLYNISIFILRLLDFVEMLFRALADLPAKDIAGFKLELSLNGQTGNLMLQVLKSSSVQMAFLSMCVVGVFLIVVMTAFQIIKVEYTTEGAKNAKGPIFQKAFKGVALLLLTPLLVVFGVVFANQLLNLLDIASKANASSTISGQIFITSASDAHYLEGELKYEFGENANGVIARQIQSQMLAYLSFFDSIVKSFKGESGGPDSFAAYERDEKARADIDLGFAAQEDGYKYYLMSDVSKYYKYTEINYLLLILSGCFVLKALAFACFGLVIRLYKVAVLFIVSPAIIGMSVLNEKVLGSWRKAMIGQVVAAYGVVLAINLFFIIVGVLLNIELKFIPAGGADSTFGVISSGMMTLLLKVILVISGCVLIEKFSKEIGEYFGADDLLAPGREMAKKGVELAKKGIKMYLKFYLKALELAATVAAGVASAGAGAAAVKAGTTAASAAAKGAAAAGKAAKAAKGAANAAKGATNAAKGAANAGKGIAENVSKSAGQTAKKGVEGGKKVAEGAKDAASKGADAAKDGASKANNPEDSKPETGDDKPAQDKPEGDSSAEEKTETPQEESKAPKEQDATDNSSSEGDSETANEDDGSDDEEDEEDFEYVGHVGEDDDEPTPEEGVQVEEEDVSENDTDGTAEENSDNTQGEDGAGTEEEPDDVDNILDNVSDKHMLKFDGGGQLDKFIQGAYDEYARQGGTMDEDDFKRSMRRKVRNRAHAIRSKDDGTWKGAIKSKGRAVRARMARGTLNTISLLYGLGEQSDFSGFVNKYSALVKKGADSLGDSTFGQAYENAKYKRGQKTQRHAEKIFSGTLNSVESGAALEFSNQVITRAKVEVAKLPLVGSQILNRNRAAYKHLSDDDQVALIIATIQQLKSAGIVMDYGQVLSKLQSSEDIKLTASDIGSKLDLNKLRSIISYAYMNNGTVNQTELARIFADAIGDQVGDTGSVEMAALMIKVVNETWNDTQ